MSAHYRKLASTLTLCAAGFAVAWLSLRSTEAADPAAKPSPQPNKSQIVRWDDAGATTADWGEMRRYFTGQTAGTKDVLVAAAVIQPGKAVHRAHRHAEEEYLMLVEGNGTWSLDGKEIEAKRGDVLYAEPWVFHGLTNTGDRPLIFAVVRYNAKGVKVPPRPNDGKKDEM
jgi:mannose-6-phosphate isomerase-like protein (cupin superfamily)